jgi:catechol 2,3-dioxygenase-like lactoylglutathione lyase family enzyme
LKILGTQLLKKQLDVGLVTADSDKARQFYGKVMGYPEEEPATSGSGTQYRFRVGGQLIKLMDLPDKPATNPSEMYAGIGYRVLAIFVDDLPGLRERILATGKGVTEPEIVLGKLTISFAKDADGNMLELIGLPEPRGDSLLDRVQVGLTVADAERSRQFYGEVLGLSEHPQMAMPEGLTRYAFSAGTTTIKFWSKGPDLPRFAGPFPAAVGIRFVTFSVDDAREAARQLEMRGARIAVPPMEIEGRARIFFVEDPDGNWIEFAEPL